MKVRPADIERSLRNLDPEVAVYCFYGPDSGLAAERARGLVQQVVDDPQDPFLVSDLDSDGLRQSPGRLIEEAQAISMLGGRRVVRVRQATDALSKPLGELLAMDAIEAVVTVEAGDLGPGSSLRKLTEKAKNALAIPCYRDEGRGVEATIREVLSAEHLKIDRDALAWLQAHLGANRELTRREAEKLALIAMDRADQSIGLDDVAAAVGDQSALAIDDWIFLSLQGDLVAAQQRLKRLLAEGVPPVRLARSLASTTLRLLDLRRQIDRGATVDQVIAGARPPIHFRARPRYQAALSKLSTQTLTQLATTAVTTERRCKQTGMPDHLLAAAMTTQTCAESQRSRRR